MKNKPAFFGIFFLAFFICHPRAEADCWFYGVGDVNFGFYDTLSGTRLDSTGSVSIDCNLHTDVVLSISASPNSGGFNPRSMRNPSSGELLNYNLYRNSSRTEIWGDGTQGTYTVSGRVNRNFIRTWTIYGRIPSGQDVGIGNYGEILVITLTF